MTGGSDTCFLAELNVNNDKFLVRVDTGSSDTVLPRPNLNNYVGPTVDIIIPADADIRSSQYGDGSTWTGYMVRLEAGMGVTEGIVPLALMTSQSTNPIFSAGDDGVNGLMGLGYPNLAKTRANPKTFVQSWYNNGVISKNEVAMHGCPYDKANMSWIDVGNTTPYSDCGNYSVTIGIPTPSYYNLDILATYINNQAVDVGNRFQALSNGRKMYSILDSCTSHIIVPSAIMNTIRPKIVDGLSDRFARDRNLNSWLNAEIALAVLDSDFKWDILPTLGFTIGSQDSSFKNITIVLGPRDYIQTDSSGRFCNSIDNS